MKSVDQNFAEKGLFPGVLRLIPCNDGIFCQVKFS
jgi:hypothetical protein